jgi:hypothetical protein
MPEQLVDLFYKEAIGNPVSPSGYTEEYCVLRGVTAADAQRYRDAFNWIRAEWRTALSKEVR